ncbi:uncharacterized protein BCN122_I2336 [Burkholderia cenocepacia]|nr:uncharacterized protein BCN122_I2336 [Burkholderia cenocepacia]
MRPALAFSARSRTTEEGGGPPEGGRREGSTVVGRPARGAAGRVGGGAGVRFVCAGRWPVRRRRHARQERLLSGMRGMIGHALFCDSIRS